MSKNALIGFLLIHGFASTKYSFQILVDSLKEKGYVVDALDLPGHNTSPQDMIGVKWTNWTDYCQNCLDNLKEKCKKVYIIGTSLGGTLTLYLGSTNPDIDGLIALATPYKSFNSKMKMLELFPFVKHLKKWHNMDEPKLDDIEALDRLKHYPKFPMESAIEFAKLMKNLRKNLSSIEHPLLLIYSKNDPTIPSKQIKNIYQIVGSRDKTIVCVNKGKHSILVDAGRYQALEAIEQWLKERKKETLSNDKIKS